MPRRMLSLLTPVLLTAGLVVTAPPVSAIENLKEEEESDEDTEDKKPLS